MDYAVTARKTNKPITKQHYYDYLAAISDLGEIGNVNFELKRGLHCHFVVRAPKPISRPQFRPTKRGWNVRAVPMSNRRNWKAYIRKDRFLGDDDPIDMSDNFVMPTRSMFK